MEQMNGSPLSLLSISAVSVVTVASVVLSFVSPWGTVVGVDVDEVVWFALVISFVSPSVVGVVVVMVVVAQVVPELVETEAVPAPTGTTCSFVSPCCSCAEVGGLLPVGLMAGLSNKYPSA